MDKAKFIGGMVKTVFILCYVAFMVASIRHVATFFNDFEPNGDNMVGSYALAGAFDVTALVTTIGVMFFRKSMPSWVFWIVWTFIAAIAIYSYIINLEYAFHYQDTSLLMQPTGDTTPVLDSRGNVHYVAVMQVNTTLLWVNPFLASGFTIFSLIYSVIAEFFGAKPPTAEELLAHKKYLEETSKIQEEIAQLESSNKKTGIIESIGKQASGFADGQKAKAEARRNELLNATVDYLRDAAELLDKDQEKRALKALSTYLKIREKEALPLLIAARSRMAKEEQKEQLNQESSTTQDNEVLSVNGEEDETQDEEEQVLSATQDEEVDPVNGWVIEEEDKTQDDEEQGSNEEKSNSQDTGQMRIDGETMRVITHYPEIASWLKAGKSTVSIEEIIKATSKRKSTVEDALTNKQLKRSRNSNLIRVSSVVSWLNTMPIRNKSNATKERTTGELEAVSVGN